MQGEGAGEVTLVAIRGQLLRSSIFLLDSVLSARALMLLNTTGRPPLWLYACLQPCVNEVNIHWPHAWPNVGPGVNLEITLSDTKWWGSPFRGTNKVTYQYGWPYAFFFEWGLFTWILSIHVKQCRVSNVDWQVKFQNLDTEKSLFACFFLSNLKECSDSGWNKFNFKFFLHQSIKVECTRTKLHPLHQG